MTIGALGWNLLYVSDLATMRNFYENVMGLTVRWETEGIVALSTGGCTLELMERPGMDNPRTGWDRSPLLMSFHVDDIDATIAELISAGAEQFAPIRHVVGVDAPEWRLAQFIDPEGNLFELCDEPVGWFPDD